MGAWASLPPNDAHQRRVACNLIGEKTFDFLHPYPKPFLTSTGSQDSV